MKKNSILMLSLALLLIACNNSGKSAASDNNEPETLQDSVQSEAPELAQEENKVPDFFKPTFEGNHVECNAPKDGENWVISEFIEGWEKHIIHTYKPDGKRVKIEIEDFDKMFKMYKDYDDMYKSENATFAKFSLLDLDDDQIPELWFQSANGEDGAFYAINTGKIALLITQNYHSSIALHKGAIQQSGGCGTGCHAAFYATVKNSEPGPTVRWFTEYDMEGEKVAENFMRDEKPITLEEGEKFVESLGDAIDINPKWYPLEGDVL